MFGRELFFKARGVRIKARGMRHEEWGKGQESSLSCKLAFILALEEVSSFAPQEIISEVDASAAGCYNQARRN